MSALSERGLDLGDPGARVANGALPVGNDGVGAPLAERTPYCGTTTGYRRGCRCDDCRETYSQYQRGYSLGVKRKQGRPFAPIKHGTANAYVKRKCRCRECKLYWREYSRESQRKWRAAKKGINPESMGRKPHRSICIVCGKDFVQKKSAKTCSNKCGVKSWRDRKRSARVYTTEFSERAHAVHAARVATELSDAVSKCPELEEIIAEQERDARLGDFVGGSWTVSLDATLSDDGSERHEILASDDLDPAMILLEKERLTLLATVTGGRSEEDVRRLDFRTQEWLADKLREEGLVGSISVTRKERERLRDPQAHSGERIHSHRGHGGRSKRLEKVSANRHSRPSQKPRKRWTRQDAWDEAAGWAGSE